MTDLLDYKRYKDMIKKEKDLSLYVLQLDKFSEYLFNNMTKYTSCWALLHSVEDCRITEYCNLLELRKMLHSYELRNNVKK